MVNIIAGMAMVPLFDKLSCKLYFCSVGQLPIEVDMDTISENPVQFHIEQPPPLPPKMAKGVQGDL